VESKWPPAPQLLAAGLGGAAILVALAYLLKLILPILFASFGLAFAAATTGFATAGFIATWVAPAAAGGTAVIAGVVSVKLLHTVTMSAEAKPYEWTLPLLGTAAGVLVNLSNDLVIQAPVLRVIFGGIAALWVVIAGACYKRSGWRWKVTAAFLYLLPPLAVLGSILQRRVSTSQAYVTSTVPPSVASYFSVASGSDWIALCGFALIGIVVVCVERLTRDQS
jgi:hypothetical protein